MQTADCGCWYHAEQGIPCRHDLALKRKENGMKSIANLSGSEVTEAEIRRFMRGYVGHGNPPTSTELAEATAEHFDLYEDEVDYPIPERLFEISEEILPTT